MNKRIKTLFNNKKIEDANLSKKTTEDEWLVIFPGFSETFMKLSFVFFSYAKQKASCKSKYVFPNYETIQETMKEEFGTSADFKTIYRFTELLKRVLGKKTRKEKGVKYTSNLYEIDINEKFFAFMESLHLLGIHNKLKTDGKHAVVDEVEARAEKACYSWNIFVKSIKNSEYISNRLSTTLSNSGKKINAKEVSKAYKVWMGLRDEWEKFVIKTDCLKNSKKEKPEALPILPMSATRLNVKVVV